MITALPRWPGFLRLASVFAASAFLVGDLVARQSPDDFLAPANCWMTRGGGSARSGATRTRAVRGPIEAAWAKPFDPKGTIEGEPLVWDDTVVVSVFRGRNQRAICVLDLESGKQIAERAVNSPQSLEPSLWGNVVVFRGSPEKLIALRIGARSIDSFWGSTKNTAMGAPLLIEDRVYVTTSSGLSCFRVGRMDPLWEQSGTYFGSVAVVGRRLLTLAQAPQGGCDLCEFNLDTHENTGRATLLQSRLDLTAPTSMALLPCGAFVDFAVDLPWSGGRPAPRILGFSAGDRGEFTDTILPGSACMRSLPARAGQGWMAKIMTSDGARQLAYIADATALQSAQILAGPEDHPELIVNEVPVTVAGSVAYAGACAFEIETGRILWQQSLHPTERAVPAGGTVLIVDEGKRIVALRERSSRRDALSLPAMQEPVRGALVLRDGSIEKGEFTLDAAANALSRLEAKSPSKPWNLSDVLLFEDQDGRILAGADPVRGLREEAEAELASGYLALGSRACKTNDPALIEGLAALAAMHGADLLELKPLQLAIDKLRNAKRAASIQAAGVEEIKSQTDALAHRPAALFLDRAAKLPESIRERLDTRLLRTAIELDPADAAVRDVIRAMLPAELRPTGAFDARDALTFIEATRRTPVSFVAVPPPGTLVTESQAKVGQRMARWRKDLYGIQSANLLIITPVKQHGMLAHCLALGELVCKALQDICSGGAASLENRAPMVIELYESREAYLAHATRDKEDASRLTWTAGLFDPAANVSRFYFPEKEDDLGRVLETAVHEFTHHWLFLRCPAWPFKPLSDYDPTQSGYWIVEGFACFVSDLDFDIGRGTWALKTSTSPDLDIAVNGAGKYLPWKKQFGLSHLSFGRTGLGDLGMVASSRLLGRGYRSICERSMFYAQAAATVRYLYEADNGALRGKLLEFLRAYYTGDVSNLDLTRLVAIEADELGRRILEHARNALENH